MEKIKLQVYLTEELHSKLMEEAERKGISAPATIVDILSTRYLGTTESEADVSSKVIDQFSNYVPKSENGEFTIHEASPTYVAYPQYRAVLGKKIALAVAEGKFEGISVVRTRSGSVKRRRDGSAVYIKKQPENK